MRCKTVIEEQSQQGADGQLDLLAAMTSAKASSPPLPAPVALPHLSGPLPTPIPERLLIIDTETTGLDPDRDHCLEVGCILFHVPSRAVLAQQSFLLPVAVNAAEAINRIPAEVTRLEQPWHEGLAYLQSLIDAADLLVAHNANFDRQWFGRGPLPQASRPWLCTMDDLAWPGDRQLRSRPSVRDLALAYGVPVWAAHRALTDCIYIAEVFSRCDDLEELLERGLEPRQLMRAQVSYEQRHLAREAGFRWNDPVKGAWARRLSEREAARLSFPVINVEAEAGRQAC
ncbi:MAG: 3'-5' exonuclease [Prochlorococcus sp.]|nr:3'-5' exonuclease [Prochlorococcaceae cyanobacterium Fu_MAG_50]